MRQLTVILFVFFFIGGAGALRAQSLKNTAWKFYVDGLNDSLTMHIGTDSSFTTSSSGEMIVRSLIKVVNDTVRINDLDGQYPCTDGEGVYKYMIDGDDMRFLLVTDPCLNRSNALKDTKFKRTTVK